MRIPTPQQLGLPAKFDRWRPDQERAIANILQSPKRVKALSAPTGFGKTAVYIAVALISKRPTCIVTDSRALQDQLLADFESCGLVDIRGRRNYPCDLGPDYTCEDGYAARCPYKGTVGCPSSQAEMRAASSALVVTNYDKWTSARKFGQGMSHFQQVVFDEGHKSPDALARAMSVTLNNREIGELLGLDFPLPSLAAEFVNWKPWASAARAEAENYQTTLRTQLQNVHVPAATVRKYVHLRNLTKRLATVATANPTNWIVDELEKGYQFDPIRPGRYSEAMLLLNIPSIIVVSATLRPKTMFMIGIAQTAFDFQEYDSGFDPALSPIYYVPTMRVDSKHPDLSQLWIKIDQIAAPRQDRKGIIDTISYARRDEILQRSRFAPKMLINTKGEASTGIVEEFKRSAPGTILVSPSVGEGFDFPGPACEWILVCKIPFPDSRSKIVKARQEDDKEWGPYKAIQKLEQTFGRGTRFKGDRCEGFIVDQNLDWFLPRFGHLATKSFHRRWKQVDVVPQPPKRLE